MTDTLTPQLDARHAAEFHDEFSEDEMTAIDRAVVNVYVNTRAILPPPLLGAGRGDPAAALRSYAYMYAAEHPAEIHDRIPGHIYNHMRGRVQQHVKRELAKRRERPYGIGQSFARRLAHREQRTRVRVTQPPPRVDSLINHHSIDLYGRILPSDQMQFMAKGRRAGKPVFEDPAIIARLHTRKPTRLEFWHEVCDEWDRKAFRKQLAQTFAAGICACEECTTP